VRRDDINTKQKEVRNMKIRILSGMSLLMILLIAMVPVALSDQIFYTDAQDMVDDQVDIRDVIVYNDESNVHFTISVYASEILPTPKKCFIWVVNPVVHDIGSRIEPDGSITTFFDGQVNTNITVTIVGTMYEFVVPRVLLGNPPHIDFYIKSWSPEWGEIGYDCAPDFGCLTYHWHVPPKPKPIPTLTPIGLVVLVGLLSVFAMNKIRRREN
jgi:hypothetical protein